MKQNGKTNLYFVKSGNGYVMDENQNPPLMSSSPKDAKLFEIDEATNCLQKLNGYGYDAAIKVYLG